MYIICIIVSLIICFSFIIIYKKKKDRFTQHFLADARQQYIDENHAEMDREVQNLILTKQKELENLNQQLLQMQEIFGTYEKSEKEKISERLNDFEKEKIERINKDAAQYEQERKNEIAANLNEIMAKNSETEQQMQDSLNKIRESLEEFQKKQETVNAEIMRRREIEEKKDFYKIRLSEEALADIEILKQTKKNLKKPEFIDKMIYDNYIAKPVLEMEKRVLQNTAFSGIYKITCLKTGEIYIGKSTDIKTRWQQHCKTAFNCGNIASSLLHTKMQQYGVENFTFEVLEKVPKENLSEREKFYINFYQTKEVGLNERLG